MTKYINILVILVVSGCAQMTINCSETCIDDGISTTGTECGDTLMENHDCKEPIFGEPEEGAEALIIRAHKSGDDSEKVTILYLDEKADGFWISGQLRDWDLGAGVYIGKALIGIIDGGEGHERFVRNIGR